MLLFDDYKKIMLDKIKTIYSVQDNDMELGTNFGDFTLKIFKFKDNREEVYSRIKSSMDMEFIDRVELQGNYINFYVKPGKMLDTVENSIGTFGKYPNTFQDTSKALIEHTSSNPTGPIHVGRIRNSIIGDSIFRIIERYGTRSLTQYFVNDSGKQVISLYLGHIKYHKDEEMTVENLLDGYQKIYTNIDSDPDIKREVQELDEKYETGDNELIKEIQNTASIVLKSITDSLAKLGIHISTYVWESNFIMYGNVAQLIDSLSEDLKSEGKAKYIEIGDKKIFLTRQDGTSLYFARDLVYHMFKSENFDWIIDVLGEDHKDHAKNLDYVLHNYLDFPSRIDYLFYGFVSLDTGKMSTRKGNIVTVNDLYEKTVEESAAIIKQKRPEYSKEEVDKISNAIAASSIRYNIIKINANKPLTFRWDEALNFEGDSAPYIMYAYARACSLISKTGNTESSTEEYNEFEKALIKAMYVYPYYLQNSVDFLRADIIAGYILYLVKSFNEFYLNCPIIGNSEENKRMRIVRAFKKIMEDSADLLGIQLLEKI
ncbi:arginine--tRNA ligase [Ferroplasma acidiphilum]|uniref:arginine--tRNA ligase n=1 Tax=Ferroplasma acidiphilum TaxID=74969 RepID=UPI0023F1B067|nr:arginine--tRNA ligase [Ferroplasma acidiphilum]MCL4349297.1 arginine--tRNA ligase [Candidatus Thermoplasmatota archaeon]WMT52556.1 MAG: arginine--tRNA ligase [Ferroplasma acidiphilum]